MCVWGGGGGGKIETDTRTGRQAETRQIGNGGGQY